MRKKLAGILAFAILMVACCGTMTTYAEAADWQYDGNGWWYRFSDGSYPVDCWQLIDEKWYHFDSVGYMQTGWIWDGGAWYHLDSSGAMQTGWLWDGAWYYLVPNGAMAVGWIFDGSHWYYMNSSGAMRTGWIWDGGGWYYLSESGAMQTGWVWDGGGWYYLSESGAMQTGWIWDGKAWYYLSGSGAMQTGWFWNENAGYYLSSSGAMVTGKQTIDGETYVFTADGAVTLSVGSEGEPVYKIQDILANLGYLKSSYDGYYGEITAEAVRAFQKDNGLSATGNADAQTINVLLHKGGAEESQVRKLAREVLDSVGWDLYAAYQWSVGINYNINLVTGSTTSEAAVYSFTTYTGDCVSMASTFCWMARMLGYTADVIDGQVPYRIGGYGEHAWVEIVVDGATYVCDPDFEMQTGNNGYMINYGQSGTWKYVYGYIMED